VVVTMKPCPRCNEKVRVGLLVKHTNRDTWFVGHCSRCGHTAAGRRSRKAARAAWNRDEER